MKHLFFTGSVTFLDSQWLAPAVRFLGKEIFVKELEKAMKDAISNRFGGDAVAVELSVKVVKEDN